MSTETNRWRGSLLSYRKWSHALLTKSITLGRTCINQTSALQGFHNKLVFFYFLWLWNFGWSYACMAVKFPAGTGSKIYFPSGRLAIEALRIFRLWKKVGGKKFLFLPFLFQIRLRQHGPAVTLHIKLKNGNQIDVDLVPVIEFRHPSWPTGVQKKGWMANMLPEVSICRAFGV